MKKTRVEVLFATPEDGSRRAPSLLVTRTQYGVRVLVIDEDGDHGLYLTDEELAGLIAALAPTPHFTHCRQCGHVEVK